MENSNERLAMTLEAITDESAEGAAFIRLLKELQSDKKTVVAGAAANTNIAVAGIGLEDTITSVVEYQVSGGNVVALVDRTSVAAVQAAGQIRLTAATVGSTLVVEWADKTA